MQKLSLFLRSGRIAGLLQLSLLGSRNFLSSWVEVELKWMLDEEQNVHVCKNKAIDCVVLPRAFQGTEGEFSINLSTSS